nr:immunoglobulin heavy chain junction region [Macaca mulatta]MOX02187.1 immunoglobulin heavy chain junction region [Macaca mulatta]MOX03727.1 immunoglobulin heavy chain junction region [Macaca mulatta]MOX05196.1 immunoglobulin heavy chain junction region [Macaca mulatta]MOX05278.1 immunoglobulin heavy chain junction region [Macaca mulatta]
CTRGSHTGWADYFRYW